MFLLNSYLGEWVHLRCFFDAFRELMLELRALLLDPEPLLPYEGQVLSRNDHESGGYKLVYALQLLRGLPHDLERWRLLQRLKVLAVSSGPVVSSVTLLHGPPCVPVKAVRELVVVKHARKVSDPSVTDPVLR